MMTARRRGPATALAAASLLVLVSGCIVSGGGYGPGYDVSLGAGLDYYEPRGDFYGGWPPGYQVGPSREGGHRADRAGQRAAPTYRPAPPGQPIPSLPTRTRPKAPRARGLPGHPSQRR
jgi:hypothetical protein